MNHSSHFPLCYNLRLCFQPFFNSCRGMLMSMSWSVCRNDNPNTPIGTMSEMCLGKRGVWTGEGTSKEHLVRSTARVWRRHLGKERPSLRSLCGLYSGANLLIMTTYGVCWFSPQSGFGPHKLDWWLCSRQASAELQSLTRTWEYESKTGPSSDPRVGWGIRIRALVE